MSARIPAGAFEHYVGLGSDRSYEQVAEHFNVTKRAITKVAAREHWKERLERIEREAQARVDQRLTETLEQMRLRHTKMLRAMASRAVKALQEYPLTSGMEGLRAAEAVIKLERLIAGEVTERASSTVEVLVRNEFDQLMVPAGEEDDVPEDWIPTNGGGAADPVAGSHEDPEDEDADED